MSKKTRRPRDINQLAKFIVDVATGEEELPENKPTDKNPAAVALGKLGGLKGGKARAAKLTAEQRKAIARIAVTARWETAYWNEMVTYFETIPESQRPPSYRKYALIREIIALSHAETRQL